MPGEKNFKKSFWRLVKGLKTNLKPQENFSVFAQHGLTQNFRQTDFKTLTKAKSY
jgi:hypothetical protein